ncbi:MAG: FMN-binding protein [Gemmatimonadota bacterium]
MIPRAGAAATGVLLALLSGGRAHAQSFPTQEEALRLAFPAPAEIQRRTAFLDEAQIEKARRLAGPDVKIRQRVVIYYIGTREGDTLGFAYFDAHRVRTHPEVLMLVVSADGKIGRIETLKFAEPPEYRPPERWLRQFGRFGLSSPGGGGRSKGEIIKLTGATLTTRAVTRAVRRVLALHAVLTGRGESGR